MWLLSDLVWLLSDTDRLCRCVHTKEAHGRYSKACNLCGCKRFTPPTLLTEWWIQLRAQRYRTKD